MDTWAIETKTNAQRGKREGGKPRNRLLTIKNTLIITRRKVSRGIG